MATISMFAESSEYHVYEPIHVTVIGDPQGALSTFAIGRLEWDLEPTQTIYLEHPDFSSIMATQDDGWYTNPLWYGTDSSQGTGFVDIWNFHNPDPSSALYVQADLYLLALRPGELTIGFDPDFQSAANF